MSLIGREFYSVPDQRDPDRTQDLHATAAGAVPARLHDTGSLADVTAQRDALIGALVDRSMRAWTAPCGIDPEDLPDAERARLEQSYVGYWRGISVVPDVDDDVVANWRRVARGEAS